MTKRLDLINSMLSTTGTAKLTAEDDNHPNYIAANDILEEEIEDMSSMELWFNTSIRTLSVNGDGKVPVPSNAIAVDPVDIQKDYVVRGQYLFDMGDYTDVIEEDVECRITYEVDLEDWPVDALKYLRASTRFLYFLDQDGSASKLQVYAQVLQKQEIRLAATNMKHSDANFFLGRGYAQFARRRGSARSALNLRIE